MSDEQNSATARIKARSLAIMWVGADQEEAFVDDIAAALLAAEQRGRNDAKHQAAVDTVELVMAHLSQWLHEEGIE